MGKYTLTVRRIGLSATISPLVYLSNIILLPILTRNLVVADYGTFALILITLGLLPSLVALGLHNSLIRFGAAAKDKRDIRELFYSMGFIVLVASWIVCGLFLLFAPQIAASLFHNNLTTALLLIPNIFIACLTFFAWQYFVTYQQIKRYTWLNLFNAYLETALVAYFVLSGYGLEGAVIALLIEQLVVFSIMMYLIVAEIGFAIPKLTHVREYLNYGLPLVPGSLSSWVVNSSDRYLIALFLGAAADFACANHAADRDKRLLSYSVCCRRKCAPRSVLVACHSNRIKKEDRHNWHDMGSRRRLEFRVKLSAHPLFGPCRCCTDDVPRVPARVRVDYNLFI
jgi:O-antigen/teichoic acid export membrane protein